MLFAAMSVIWGIPYLFIRVAVAEISPAALVFVRTGVGALILLPVALARVDMREILRHWRWVVAFAFTEIAIPWVLLSSAEQQVTSSLAGLLVAGVPLMGVVVAAVTGSSSGIGGRGLLGLLIGLAGVAAIVGVDVNGSNQIAMLEIAVVVVGYAIGPAILSRRLAGVPSLGIMASSLTLCALLYLPIAVLERPAAMPSAAVFGSVAILGVLCTAAAFLLFADLIAEIGPVRATVITYINPAVAGILGVAVLREPFTPGMVIG